LNKVNIVPTCDTGDHAQAIGSLLEDPERRRRMGLAGRERALRLFDWDRTAEQFEQLYREVGAKVGR
jgi:glycosyltransferase involved in cell wall biosynthesis